MTKMDKQYIEKEYEQAIKEYNAALTETENNRKHICFLGLQLSPTCRLLFSHVLTSFEAEEGFFFVLQSRNFSLQ